MAGCTSKQGKQTEWNNQTIDAYNIYGLENDRNCPKIPGVFFEFLQGNCVTFLSALVMKKTTKLVVQNQKFRWNPNYRYSVPVLRNPSSVDTHKFSPSKVFAADCEKNPKINYILHSVSTTHTMEVTPGIGEVTHPKALEAVDGGAICRIVLKTNKIGSCDSSTTPPSPNYLMIKWLSPVKSTSYNFILSVCSTANRLPNPPVNISSRI